MALIKCPECQTEVSEKAANCPKCAYPLTGGGNPQSAAGAQAAAASPMRKIVLVVVGVLVLAGTYWWLMGSRDRNPDAVSTSAPRQEAANSSSGATPESAPVEEGKTQTTSAAVRPSAEDRIEFAKQDKQLQADEKGADSDARRSLFRLGLIRSRMAIYYGDSEGKYPSNLEDLVTTGFLEKMPVMNNGAHDPTSRVTNYDDVDPANPSAVQDTGGWGYVNNPASKQYGQVFVNCTHKTGRADPEYWEGF